MISEILNKEYNGTRVPLYIPSERSVTTRQSPELMLTGHELVESIKSLEDKIASLQQAKRNAEALLNGEIEGSLDPEYTGSIYHKLIPINAE